MRLPKVEYGDVFSAHLTTGFGLIQCVKEAPNTDCEIIRVLPGVYEWGAISIPDLIEKFETGWTPEVWM